MYRSRKSTLAYQPDKQLEAQKSGERPCPFCSFGPDQISKEYKHFWIVKNLYAYQYWELMDVTDHLMIVPKKHIESIDTLTKVEKVELIDIMAEWEGMGYNLYARESANAMKSVLHQHTHLIKTKNKKARFSLYLKRPYLLIKK